MGFGALAPWRSSVFAPERNHPATAGIILWGPPDRPVRPPILPQQDALHVDHA